MGSTQTSPRWTLSQRIDALRDAAEWCREGAPGGAPRALFSPEGPCALGKVLLNLEPSRGRWLLWLRSQREQVFSACDVILGKGEIDFDDPRVVRANADLAEAAAGFDDGAFRLAARRLEHAAEMLESCHEQPVWRELTVAEISGTDVLPAGVLTPA